MSEQIEMFPEMVAGDSATVYLAGPMSGSDDGNEKAFREARERLRAEGFTVFCPHEFGMEELGVKGQHHDDADAEKLVAWDVHAIIASDYLVLLPGWQKSTGVACEIHIAKLMGKMIVEMSEFVDWILDGQGDNYRELRLAPVSGDDRFMHLMNQMKWLHCKKNADYGSKGDPLANVRASEQWGVPAWVGAMIRASDKVHRLKAAASGSQLQNEGVIDSLMDLAAYSLIALVLYQEGEK